MRPPFRRCARPRAATTRRCARPPFERSRRSTTRRRSTRSSRCCRTTIRRCGAWPRRRSAATAETGEGAMSPSKGGQRRAAGVRAAVAAGSLVLLAAMLALRASGVARADDESAASANDDAAHAVWVAGPVDPLGRDEPAIEALDDSAAVVAFLAAVRGVDPVVCDLAVRTVDQGWGWGGSETPASAAARDARVREILRAVTRDLRDAAVVAPLRAGLSDADHCVRRMSGPLLGRSDAPGA